jgi:uncharacterized damage-inducible protein DinB
MNKGDIELLIDYNYWANKKILDQATKVTDEQFVEKQATGISHGSLHGTLVHTLSAEWLWRMRMQNGVSPSAMLSELEFPTLASLILRWGTEEMRMREFVEGLSEERLQEVVNYISVTGAVPRANTRAHALAHMVFHGMQHRSECAVLLTNFGHSPGNIDLLYYLVEKGIA